MDSHGQDKVNNIAPPISSDFFYQCRKSPKIKRLSVVRWHPSAHTIRRHKRDAELLVRLRILGQRHAGMSIDLFTFLQAQIYETSAKGTIKWASDWHVVDSDRDVVDGYNGTIFAYGMILNWLLADLGRSNGHRKIVYYVWTLLWQGLERDYSESRSVSDRWVSTWSQLVVWVNYKSTTA